jgi:hypothetical protein
VSVDKTLLEELVGSLKAAKVIAKGVPMLAGASR